MTDVTEIREERIEAAAEVAIGDIHAIFGIEAGT
jgi:hypothetical protein